MSSTHICLLYHLIFSTKRRFPWINGSWEERLHTYLGGIVRGLGGVPGQIGGIADHVHLAVSLKATHCLADIMMKLKSRSSEWVHDVMGLRMFGWQDGYGAFTVSRADMEFLKQYIQDQKEHHRKRTFQEEYVEMLRQSGIDFDERYLW